MSPPSSAWRSSASATSGGASRRGSGTPTRGRCGRRASPCRSPASPPPATARPSTRGAWTRRGASRSSARAEPLDALHRGRALRFGRRLHPPRPRRRARRADAPRPATRRARDVARPAGPGARPARGHRQQGPRGVRAGAGSQRLARRRRRLFLHEGAGRWTGRPCSTSPSAACPGASVLGFRGTLNSTTSLHTARMEEGRTAAEALREAQAAGIAEADPAPRPRGLGRGGEGMRAGQRPHGGSGAPVAGATARRTPSRRAMRGPALPSGERLRPVVRRREGAPRVRVWAARSASRWAIRCPARGRMPRCPPAPTSWARSASWSAGGRRRPDGLRAAVGSAGDRALVTLAARK